MADRLAEEEREKEQEQEKTEEVEVRETTVSVKRRGLASASKAVRLMVASKGGRAPHQEGKRGLQAASEQTRQRVAKIGGDYRAQQPESLSKAGALGASVVMSKHGLEHYKQIGHRGGSKISANREHMQQIGKKGGQKVKELFAGTDYYRQIPKMKKKNHHRRLRQ